MSMFIRVSWLKFLVFGLGLQLTVSNAIAEDCTVANIPLEQLFQKAMKANPACDQYGTYADVEIKTNAQSVTQRFRWIEPGTFMMGSPESEKGRDDNEVHHQVTLTKGYWIFDTEVTQALWKAVMDNNPSYFKRKQRPVEKVSWNDVQQFFKKVNQLNPKLNLELPTEAQWEYAARAGTTTPFSFGENITTDQVNYNGNYPYNNGQKGKYREHTVDVKSLPPNPWGLYEVHGNVWEWTADAGGEPSAKPVSDPFRQAGAWRVIRGGSWSNDARYCRSAYRYWLAPDDRYFNFGFRPSAYPGKPVRSPAAGVG